MIQLGGNAQIRISKKPAELFILSLKLVEAPTTTVGGDNAKDRISIAVSQRDANGVVVGGATVVFQRDNIL